ncbi:MAG: peptidase BlaR1 [Polyangiaceae bacterium]|jgi:beta-lactamase regulating signal transducer with metallopeptidase domain|nr:peptidase BlaR1 [Polyangiaceae bacterium]
MSVLIVAVALVLVLAWLVAGAFAALSRVARFLSRTGKMKSTVLAAALAMAPALLSVLGLVVILVPNPLRACHCMSHGPGHPHLCLVHPWLAAPVLPWAAPLLMTWLIFAGVRATLVLREIYLAERTASCLRQAPSALVDGVAVKLIDGTGQAAFTIGLFNPVIVIERDVWAQLEPAARRAIVHHERAHASRHDGLTLACLRLIAAGLPWPSQGDWLGAWRAASEAACDRHAATQLQDATSVALALIAVERLRLQTTTPAISLAAAAGTQLETRVRALLSPAPRQAMPLANDALALGIIALGVSLLVLAWPGSSLHHAAESLLGELVH